MKSPMLFIAIASLNAGMALADIEIYYGYDKVQPPVVAIAAAVIVTLLVYGTLRLITRDAP